MNQAARSRAVAADSLHRFRSASFRGKGFRRPNPVKDRVPPKGSLWLTRKDSKLLRTERLRQARQILWSHADETCVRAVNLKYQEESD